MANPFAPFFEAQGVIVLDGGLATELESRGHDLDDPLWSAKVLLEEPESVRSVHLDYLHAGADCISTVTYQATVPGLVGRGLSHNAALETFSRAVALACGARDEFWSDPKNRRGRLRPLVAASVGPYGAFLADGSEYTGDYGLSAEELIEFHRERWEVLSRSGADLLACETIPSAQEARALASLVVDTATRWAWMSFSCRDGRHISDGTPIGDVARSIERTPRLAALGVNCTAPRFVESLIGELRAATTLPLLVYPNSGERYDAGTKHWRPNESSIDWPSAASGWRACGASGVGGCCRVTPAEIAAVRAAVVDGRSGG